MTDRELAEEYVTKNANHILDTNNAFVSSHEAFLAGLKVGKENAELEKENAELKEQNRSLLESCEGATMMYKDLCKAKEIIASLLPFEHVIDPYALTSDFDENQKRFHEPFRKVEHFLKEVENDTTNF